jgi:hypothetical protein
MLVLDEQLLGRNLEAALGRWYRGPVHFITDLRPGTVIKDDAIPVLLRQQQQATFLTINEADFWRTAFRTKARRMGKVLRVAQRTVSYYTYRERQIRVVPL